LDGYFIKSQILFRRPARRLARIIRFPTLPTSRSLWETRRRFVTQSVDVITCLSRRDL